MADKGKFKISYFNGTGRGELQRWILAYAKNPFEDNRVERADWPKLKPTMPLTQLPVLDWTSPDGKQKVTLCQSAAISRFLANQFGLLGKNAIQTGKADEAFESMRELQEAIFKAMFEQDAARKEEALKILKTDMIPRILGYLEKRVKENGGKNVAGGDGHTYADIFIGSMFDMLNMRPMFDLAPYPSLAALAKNVAEQDGVKAYLAKRPKTEF